MRENTPPRVPDIGDDAEEIEFNNLEPPPFDEDEDDIDMEEVTLEQLEERLGYEQGPDDSKCTFREHNAPVFTGDLHPTQAEWAVTGGEDDMVYLWNTNTGEILYSIKNHKDTVTSVMFNHDGSYLASGDMAGTILVHKVQETTVLTIGGNNNTADNGGGGTSGSHDAVVETVHGITVRQVWDYAMGDMAWLRWHRKSNVLLGGSESGEVYVWRIPSGDCKILPGEGVGCEDGDLAHDGKKLFTSYCNGTVKLWDLKTCTVLMEVNSQHPDSHLGGQMSVACHPEKPLYMSGGIDGKILFCSNNGTVGTVDSAGVVECVAFSPSNEFKMAASGTLQGDLAIWDYGKYSLRTACEHVEQLGGIAKLKWLNNHMLLISTLNGNVFIYDARSGTQKFALLGHHADVYDICFNKTTRMVLTTSEDGTAKIFDLPPIDD